jgi:exodeoxyribonuclease V alpha subunit
MNRVFLDRAARLDLAGGEAELADWFASKYGRAEDTENLRWFLLYILYRHWQGHLLVRGPATGEPVTGHFTAMAPVDDTETGEYLGSLAVTLFGDLEGLVKRNPQLFGDPAGRAPVVAENGCFSFRRFRRREEKLLSLLEPFLNGSPSQRENDLPEDPLERALVLLSNRRLLIISGGPGTGKTTLVGKLLQRWIESAPCQGRSPKIALAAPTGRAASRLMEALSGNPDGPGEAVTLHKLLKFRRGEDGPGRNREYPLDADLVVVDEASMIDFNLMTSLFDALPDKARLILVGDRDQLPSVGAGALLSDFLEGADRPGHRLSGSVIYLDRIHRSIPGITRLAETVRRGDPEASLALLKEGGEPAVLYRPLPTPAEMAAMLTGLRGPSPVQGTGFAVALEVWRSMGAVIDKGLDSMGETAILTPVRKGLYGTAWINTLLERKAGTWHGRPVMMTVNNYELELFNGDRGMIFSFNGVPAVFFRDPDRGLRHFPLSRLDGLETCYVQTVHKSQGSEFKKVFLFFPEMGEGLQTREILYTGITRAREQVTLFSADALVEKGVTRRIIRDSRIREFLSGSSVR